MTDDQSPFSLDSLHNANGTSDAYFILQMYLNLRMYGEYRTKGAIFYSEERSARV
jgi:hypothetical protein